MSRGPLAPLLAARLPGPDAPRRARPLLSFDVAGAPRPAPGRSLAGPRRPAPRGAGPRATGKKKSAPPAYEVMKPLSNLRNPRKEDLFDSLAPRTAHRDPGSVRQAEHQVTHFNSRTSSMLTIAARCTLEYFCGSRRSHPRSSARSITLLQRQSFEIPRFPASGSRVFTPPMN